MRVVCRVARHGEHSTVAHIDDDCRARVGDLACLTRSFHRVGKRRLHDRLQVRINRRDNKISGDRLRLRHGARHPAHLIHRERCDPRDASEFAVVLSLKAIASHKITGTQAGRICRTSLCIDFFLGHGSDVAENMGEIGIEWSGILTHRLQLRSHAREVSTALHDCERGFGVYILGHGHRLVRRTVPAHG